MSKGVKMHRFPHGFVSGWYQADWSGEFAAGAV
jgi:hypothetical protein